MKSDSKSVTRQEFYNDFIDLVKLEIKRVTDKLNTTRNTERILRITLQRFNNQFKIRFVYDTSNDNKITAFRHYLQNELLYTKLDELYRFLNDATCKQDLRYIKFIQHDSVPYKDHLRLIRTTYKLGLTIIRIKELTKTINDLNKSLVSYKVYSNLFDEFNKNCANHILDGGEIEFANGFGTVLVKHVDMTKHVNKNVDWGKSNKYKKYLLDNGRIPYLKKDADEAAANGSEYKGEEWLIYKTDSIIYKCLWYRSHSSNTVYYSFKPSTLSSTDLRTNDEILSVCKTPDDIIKLSHGFFKKIYFLKEIIPSYHTRFTAYCLNKD